MNAARRRRVMKPTLRRTRVQAVQQFDVACTSRSSRRRHPTLYKLAAVVLAAGATDNERSAIITDVFAVFSEYIASRRSF